MRPATRIPSCVEHGRRRPAPPEALCMRRLGHAHAPPSASARPHSRPPRTPPLCAVPPWPA
eukprot:scaffold36852_cov26-Tisochrysis_lutea.AAC.3